MGDSGFFGCVRAVETVEGTFKDKCVFPVAGQSKRPSLWRRNKLAKKF